MPKESVAQHGVEVLAQLDHESSNRRLRMPLKPVAENLRAFITRTAALEDPGIEILRTPEPSFPGEGEGTL